MRYAKSLFDKVYLLHFIAYCMLVVKQGKVFTFTGTDNMEACHIIAQQLFNLTAPCPYYHCSFNGTFQSPLYGDFVASAAIYHAPQHAVLSAY